MDSALICTPLLPSSSLDWFLIAIYISADIIRPISVAQLDACLILERCIHMCRKLESHWCSTPVIRTTGLPNRSLRRHQSHSYQSIAVGVHSANADQQGPKHLPGCQTVHVHFCNVHRRLTALCGTIEPVILFYCNNLKMYLFRMQQSLGSDFVNLNSVAVFVILE